MNKMNNNNEKSEDGGFVNFSFSPDLVNSLVSLENRRKSIITNKFLKENYSLGQAKSDNVIKSALRYIKKYYKPSGDCFTKFLLARLPIISCLINYDFKNYFLKDLIAGLYVINYFK